MTAQVSAEIGQLVAQTSLEKDNQTSLIDQLDNQTHAINKMTSEQIEDLEDTLKCNICKEIFNEPVTLICNHTFCYSCIINMPASQWAPRKCPMCQVLIWLPPQHTVNFILRDVIINIYGQQKYETIKQERTKGILKKSLETEVKEEIKTEIWRTVMDAMKHTLPKDHSNPLNSPSLQTQVNNENVQNVQNTPMVYSSCCRDFNSIWGCKDRLCTKQHHANIDHLWNNLLWCRKEFAKQIRKPGELFCWKYNSIEGCPFGDDCKDKHVFDFREMRQNLLDARNLFSIDWVLASAFASAIVVYFIVVHF